MSAIDKKKFYKELIALVIPIAIQNFMLSLVSVTDAIMLGMIDQDSMSAASQAGQIQFFLNLVVMGFSTGVGIMTAQYWGRGDIRTIEKIAPTGLKMILLLGGSITLAGLIVPGFLMSILTSDDTLIELGTGYVRTVALSYVICGISQVYFALLKNTGYAKYSSAISSIAVVVNIILNAMLIFGLLGAPEMGIKGAALATVIARIIELILAIIATYKFGVVKLKWEGMLRKLEKVLFKDFMRYTTPVIGASLVWGVAYMLYTIIMGHLGGDAVAANSITAIVKNITSCIMFGVGGGTGIMIGNILGAGELGKAKAYARKLTWISFCVGLVTGCIIIAISPLIQLFVDLTDTAAGYLRITMIICGFNVCAQSINHVVLDGIFGAGGDSIFDMKNNIVFMWCCTVPLGLLAAFVWHWPVPVVFLIVSLDEIIKLPVVFWHYKKYIWLRNITREQLD